jgi:hypothetical protein
MKDIKTIKGDYMNKCLKFLLIVFVFVILNAVLSMILPYSQEYKDMMNADPNQLTIVFLTIYSAFFCYAIYYVTINSNWRSLKRIVGITFVFYMIGSFILVLEMFLFGDAFPALSRVDLILMAFSDLPAILVATVLSVKFFGKQDFAQKIENPAALTLIPRIAILGFIYMVLYILFGYFVLWQFEEARMFYGYLGNTESFKIVEFIDSLKLIPPFTYIFQFIRGIMFSVFFLPILFMLYKEGRKKIIISVCLTFLTTTVVLIIPNPFFPDIVRWAHFIEMFSSMTIFGIITGLILYMPEKRNVVE